LRLIDFVYYSTVGLRVIKKKRRRVSRERGLQHLPKGNTVKGFKHFYLRVLVYSVIYDSG